MNTAIDLGLLRGLLTAVLFVAFIGMVVWAWSGRRRSDFHAAARLPLEQDVRARRVDVAEQETVHHGD